MGHATAHFLGHALWGGAKRSNIIKFQLQSILKIFKPNFVCLLTNERFKTYQTGFLLGRMGHAPGVGLWDTIGGRRVKKKNPNFNQIWCVSYLHDRHMQRHIFLSAPPGALGRGQKVKYH